jgi:hypothetical protein
MQRQRQILSCVLAAGLLAASLALSQTPQSASAPQATQPPQTPPAAHSPYFDEASNLNKVALELKQEMDKSNKDQLSLMVVRKADAIEKLAHSLKLRMKGARGAD